MNRVKFNKKLEARESALTLIMPMLLETCMNKWKNQKVKNNLGLLHVDSKRLGVRNRRLVLLDHGHQVVWNYEKAFGDKPTQGLQR